MKEFGENMDPENDEINEDISKYLRRNIRNCTYQYRVNDDTRLLSLSSPKHQVTNMYGNGAGMCHDYYLVRATPDATPPRRRPDPPNVEDSPILPPGFANLRAGDEIVITGPTLLTSSPGGQVYFGVPLGMRGPHKAIRKQKKAAKTLTTPPST
jgi:hypothetical protein